MALARLAMRAIFAKKAAVKKLGSAVRRTSESIGHAAGRSVIKVGSTAYKKGYSKTGLHTMRAGVSIHRNPHTVTGAAAGAIGGGYLSSRKKKMRRAY